MPTNNKTQNLHLNSWLGTDKPKREDFVSDNEILDSTINAHTTNTSIHLSAADRVKLESSRISFITLAGNGEATKHHTLDIVPKFVIVYLVGSPFEEFDKTNNCMICNGGICYGEGYGGTSGITLNDTTLTLRQSQSVPSTGPFMNLNQSGKQYFCVAFE